MSVDTARRLEDLELTDTIATGEHVLAIASDGTLVLADRGGEIVSEPGEVRKAFSSIARRALLEEFQRGDLGAYSPRRDRILLRPLVEDGASTVNGIIRLDNDPEPRAHLVLAVGPGRTTSKGVRVPIEAEAGVPLVPGDKVLTAPHVGEPVPVGEEWLRLVSEADVLAVLR